MNVQQIYKSIDISKQPSIRQAQTDWSRKHPRQLNPLAQSQTIDATNRSLTQGVHAQPLTDRRRDYDDDCVNIGENAGLMETPRSRGDDIFDAVSKSNGTPREDYLKGHTTQDGTTN